MNKKSIGLFICLVAFSCQATPDIHRTLAEKINGTHTKKRRQATIDFVFDKEDLVDVINMLAGKKGVNIVLPTGANAIKSTVTLAINQKLTLDEAWDILYTLLDIAGYSLIPKKDLYVVVKNSPNIARDTVPVYINTPINTLPDTDERISYMYYLTNIKASQDFDDQINGLLKEFLPSDALFKADKNANGVLIVAKSQDIKSLVKIIEAIDQTGFQERLEVIRLRYTNADVIGKLFNDNILKTATATPAHRYRLDARNKELEATYFSRNVKVIPEPRTNSLIVLGRVQAVERVKDFIFKYVDTQLDSGKSILHVYELQYLDADTFAPVLDRIVKSTRTGGTGQSRVEGGTQVGTERYFDEVIIQADSPEEASQEGDEGKYFGGNKLIVAARNEDWKRIKLLIEQLDKPQPQVIIEVLIADLTLDDTRRIGSLTRNPKDLPFPGEVSAQAAMIDQVVLDAVNTEADPDAVEALRGVNSDLNALTVPNVDTSEGAPPLVSVPDNLEAGTTVFALNDCNGRTWNLLEVLKRLDTQKVLSHPHIIAINNQTATIKVGEERLVQDQAAAATSGITRRKKNIKANTNIDITPRISSANTVNLQITIDIDQFISNTDFDNADRINRDVVTNASVKSGDVLAIGGLVIEITEEATVQTPVLNKIPILGWLFKRKSKTITQTSLTVFISPTIIQPKLRGGIGDYTEAYVKIAKNYSGQVGLFDSLRDPITRWFFETNDEKAPSITENFVAQDEADLYQDGPVVDEIAQTEAKILDSYLETKQNESASALQQLLAEEQNPLQQKSIEVDEIATREKKPSLKEVLASSDNPLLS